MDRTRSRGAIGRLVALSFLLALAPTAGATQGRLAALPGRSAVGSIPVEQSEPLDPPEIEPALLRIEAGGNADYTDGAGNVWAADTGFVGGGTLDRGNIPIANTTNPRIYQTERYSVSGYHFTVPNGNYAVRLHFAETFSGINGAGERVFSVNVEGIPINNIDVYAEAGGRNIALVKTVNVTVNDGQLNLGFLSVIYNPEINGIEVFPRNSSIQRIEAGGNTDYTDMAGNLWTADAGYVGGKTIDYGNIAVANTADPRIHQTERYGMSGYSFPVANGGYTARLHFAETWALITGPGQRVFGVRVEGVSLGDIDIYAEAGGHSIALVKTMSVNVLDGQLDISFIQSIQNPKINGIEIIPESPAPLEPVLESLLVGNGAGQPQSAFLPGETIKLGMAGTVQGDGAATVDLRMTVRDPGGQVVPDLSREDLQVSIGPGGWSREVTRTVPATAAPGQYTAVAELRHGAEVQQKQATFTINPLPTTAIERLVIQNQDGQEQSDFPRGQVIRLGIQGSTQGASAIAVKLRWIVKDGSGAPLPELGADDVPANLGPGSWSHHITRTLPLNLIPGQYVFVGELEYQGQVQRQEATFTVNPQLFPPGNTLLYLPLMTVTSCDAYEPNDDRANSPAGPLGAGQTIQAKICSGDPEDNYFFTTTTARQVQITLSLPDAFVGHTSLWVYKRADVRQGKEICKEGAVPRAGYALLCSIPAGGSYVVRLYTDEGIVDNLNQYSLRVDFE